MIQKPTAIPLPDDLQKLRDAAWHAAEEWDGYQAIPLTDNQIYQIAYIVNALIEKASGKIAADVMTGMKQTKSASTVPGTRPEPFESDKYK